MYLATMSIGLLTLPPGSHLCQRSCSHTPIYPIYPPPPLRLPVLFRLLRQYPGSRHLVVQ